MRTYIILLFVAFLLFTSCKDDDGLPLTPDLVTVVKAYDLDNNGNSSDIRVIFNVRNNLNVSGYRIIVVPSNISNSFDVGNAITLPKERYLEIPTETFNNDYSITLPSNLSDVNDDQIRSNFEYVVAVLVLGTGNHQLSEFSRPFTLLNQGIYTGHYLGEYHQDIIGPLIPACGGGFFRFVETSITGSQGNYSGNLICTDCFEIEDSNYGLMRFIIANNIISNFSLNRSIPCYCGIRNNPQPICVGDIDDPCPGLFTGQGTINDLNFEISFSGDDCIGLSEITLTLFRQN